MTEVDCPIGHHVNVNNNISRKKRKPLHRYQKRHHDVFPWLMSLLMILQLATMVQANSHGPIPYNDYSQAASRASYHAANLERQSQRDRQASSRPTPSRIKKKKSIEEGIQNAKKFRKINVDEVVDDGDDANSENDIRLPNDADVSEEEDSCEAISDGDNNLWGVTSGFETEMADDEHYDTESRRSRRKKKRKKRRTKSSVEATDSIRPTFAPSMAPTSMPTTDSAVDDSVSATAATGTDDTTQTIATTPSLVGTTLLDKFYIASQVRVGSTKSELYQCFHLSDVATKSHPLMLKLSQNVQQMQLEHKIYSDLYARLSPDQQHLFIKVYDWVPASDATNQKVGFVMEAGLENLRGIIWRHGPMSGDVLQRAMKSIIQAVQALHQLGTVWTEVKAENFVVMPNGSIKAIDLESLAAQGEFLRCYSAETYPPELPPDSLYHEIPQVPLEYSFDIWGLGLILIEMAIGEPLFTLQRTYDVDYVRERLRNAQGIVEEARQKLADKKVDSQGQDVILQCLVVDPTQRSTCEQLLGHEYFQN